jgi:endonuclease-8
MPEGDTIHRTASRLRPALAGAELIRFEAARLRGDRPKLGDTIDAVEAVGKHLLIRFGGGLVLHSHMKMTGSWHLYRTNERWQERPHLARAVVEVAGWIAVCFAAPVVQTYREGAEPTPISHLGPDLCTADVDFDVVLERCTSFAAAGISIAEALLDQRIACGIGNVFKSEALWACRTDPFAAIEDVDQATRERLWRVASKQLRSNLQGGARTTVPGGLAVYGRQRQPCRSCGTTIEMQHHGEQARSTYWCPTCQPQSAG